MRASHGPMRAAALLLAMTSRFATFQTSTMRSRSESLASAIALSSSSWQLATIVGPVAGGLLYVAAAGAGLISFDTRRGV